MSEISPNKSKFSERNEGKEAGSVDKFSNLPLVLIHDILSIIPLRDAIKFCLLSHKWRTIWASQPDLYLSETFYGLNREDFLTFMEKSLDYHDKYGYTGCEIRLLDLYMKVEENSHSEFLAKKCMDFAFRNKVQTFRFSIRMPEYSQCFHLRDASYFAATLDSLELSYCQITNCSFLFPVLKTIHLYNVCIEGDDFTDLIAGCPQIEVLSILRCPRFFTIVVSNPTLKDFSLYFPDEGAKIKIESTNLESVQLCSIYPDNYRFQINSLKTVKRLNLHRIYCAKRALMRIINKFPLLEELHIDECSGFRSLNVSQQNLTTFVLRKCDGIKEIRIDAPKLKSLEYTGGLTSFAGIKASKELELVKLHLKPSVLNDFPVEDAFDDCMPNDCSLDRWYIWLRNCLEFFAHSKHLSLICSDEKAILFPYELTEKLLPTIPDLKNLEVELSSSNVTTQRILDGFVRILPGLKTFSLTLGYSCLKTVTELIELPQSG